MIHYIHIIGIEVPIYTLAIFNSNIISDSKGQSKIFYCTDHLPNSPILTSTFPRTLITGIEFTLEITALHVDISTSIETEYLKLTEITIFGHEGLHFDIDRRKIQKGVKGQKNKQLFHLAEIYA